MQLLHGSGLWLGVKDFQSSLHNCPQVLHKLLFFRLQDKVLLHHVISDVFGSVALGVKLEGDHLVTVGLQLAFHHVVPAAGHLEHAQLKVGVFLSPLIGGSPL